MDYMQNQVTTASPNNRICLHLTDFNNLGGVLLPVCGGRNAHVSIICW